MLSINTDEKLITMRMCLMGLLSAGEHKNCSQTELVEWAGCLAEGLLQEHRKTSNAVELAATDNQQLKAKISTLIAEIYGNKPADRGYSREEVIDYLKRVETSAV